MLYAVLFIYHNVKHHVYIQNCHIIIIEKFGGATYVHLSYNSPIQPSGDSRIVQLVLVECNLGVKCTSISGCYISCGRY